MPRATTANAENGVSAIFDMVARGEGAAIEARDLCVLIDFGIGARPLSRDGRGQEEAIYV